MSDYGKMPCCGAPLRKPIQHKTTCIHFNKQSRLVILTCPECKTETKERDLETKHTALCSFASKEQKTKEIVLLYNTLRDRASRQHYLMKKSDEKITFYLGKWKMVKQENNKLRKQNRDLKLKIQTMKKVAEEFDIDLEHELIGNPEIL